MFIVVACFAVAFLSGFLAEQTRRTKGELEDMEEHVKRVEKLASMGEMAAGLAHEIKNPLTPIRLSLERLEMKYASKSKDLDTVFYDRHAGHKIEIDKTLFFNVYISEKNDVVIAGYAGEELMSDSAKIQWTTDKYIKMDVFILKQYLE